MEIASNGAAPINLFALVAYIPNPLGKFLDDLRRTLVPGCDPHAHVTFMPPRVLTRPAEDALRQVEEYTRTISEFELEATDLGIFPVTNVVYIELGAGRDSVVELHSALNRDALAYPEPFEFHPHITLAQGLPLDAVSGVCEQAKSIWAAYPHSKRFNVSELAFVQSTSCQTWLDLATVNLHRLTRV